MSNTHRLWWSLQSRYINNQSLLLLFTITVHLWKFPSSLISIELRLPRRGLEPGPSGFWEVNSTARSSPLPLVTSIFFKIGSVLMVFLLIGSHLISHLALRQSQSMIPSLHSLLFPVAYPKVPYLAHPFLLSILLLLARWSQKIPSNIICTLTTPSCTSLSLLRILLYLLKHLPPLSLKFSEFLSWMYLNKLLLNPSKTEFLPIGTKQQLPNFLI